MADEKEIAEAIREFAKSIDRFTVTFYTCVAAVMSTIPKILDLYLHSDEWDEDIDDDDKGDNTKAEVEHGH